MLQDPQQCSSLTQIQINNTLLPNAEPVKNHKIPFTPTLNWQPQLPTITNKIYSTLSSLNSTDIYLILRWKLNLSKHLFSHILIMPHTLHAHRQNDPLDVTTHMAHHWLKLGLQSTKSRHHFRTQTRLATLEYKVIAQTKPKYLSDTL